MAEILDEVRLQSLVRLIGGGLREVVHEYINSNDLRIEELRQCNPIRNIQRVAHLAHTIKGSSANIGLKQLTESSLDLEVNAMAGKTENIHQQVARVVADYQESREVLCNFVETHLQANE